MMAEGKQAGAKAPATLSVKGLEFTPNKDFAGSWAAFELNMALSNEDATPAEKMAAYIELVEGLTGLTKDEMVEAAGGKAAPVADVVTLMAEVVKACTPKA